MPKSRTTKKGIFIVIDGGDGTGKATQTEILVKSLKKNGQTVKYVDFPRYGQKSAGLVEEHLNGKYGSSDEVGPYRASIFFAVDRYAASFEIKKWLDEGKIVVANRYTSSNMGHQTGKIKGKVARDKFLEWVNELEFKIFGIPKPDLTILLYLDPALSQLRVDKKATRKYITGGKKRDIHEDDLNHLRNAANAYLYVAKKYRWPVVDAGRGIKEISEDIWTIVTKKISAS